MRLESAGEGAAWHARSRIASAGRTRQRGRGVRRGGEHERRGPVLDAVRYAVRRLAELLSPALYWVCLARPCPIPFAALARLSRFVPHSTLAPSGRLEALRRRATVTCLGAGRSHQLAPPALHLRATLSAGSAGED